MSTATLERREVGTRRRSRDIPLRIIKGGDTRKATARVTSECFTAADLIRLAGATPQPGMSVRIGMQGFELAQDVRGPLLAASGLELSDAFDSAGEEAETVTVLVSETITAG